MYFEIQKQYISKVFHFSFIEFEEQTTVPIFSDYGIISLWYRLIDFYAKILHSHLNCSIFQIRMLDYLHSF